MCLTTCSQNWPPTSETHSKTESTLSSTSFYAGTCSVAAAATTAASAPRSDSGHSVGPCCHISRIPLAGTRPGSKAA